jgi:hypothetical protein
MPLEACRTLLEAFFSFTVFLHMQFCLHLFQQESQDPVQVILWQPHDPWSFILAGSMGILFFLVMPSAEGAHFSALEGILSHSLTSVWLRDATRT